MLHPLVNKLALLWLLLTARAHPFICTDLHINPGTHFRRLWTALTIWPVIFNQIFAERPQPLSCPPQLAAAQPEELHGVEEGRDRQTDTRLSQWVPRPEVQMPRPFSLRKRAQPRRDLWESALLGLFLPKHILKTAYRSIYDHKRTRRTPCIF